MLICFDLAPIKQRRTATGTLTPSSRQPCSFATVHLLQPGIQSLLPPTATLLATHSSRSIIPALLLLAHPPSQGQFLRAHPLPAPQLPSHQLPAPQPHRT